MPDHLSAPLIRLLGVTSAGFAAGTAAEALGVPAPYLLGALLVGLVASLSLRTPPRLPLRAHQVSQALLGVLMGSYLAPGALRAVAPEVIPLLLVTLGTVVLSLVAAYALKRTGLISGRSAVLGMAPGGSAAIVAAADDVDADARTVAFAQYFRVAMVAMSAPLVVQAVRNVPGSPAPSTTGPGIDLAVGPTSPVAVVALVALAWLGARGGRRLGLPAAHLLGPMLVAGAVAMTGLVHDFEPAGALRDLVFTVVGLEVGLRFTRASVAHVRRLLVPVLVATIAVSTGCAALASCLAALLHISVVDAYLATTPGGINAVLATASATHANLPLISSVQSLRLFLVVLTTPPLLRMAERRLRSRPPSTTRN